MVRGKNKLGRLVVMVGVGLLLCCGNTIRADTRYVDDDAPLDGDGTTWTMAFKYDSLVQTPCSVAALGVCGVTGGHFWRAACARRGLLRLEGEDRGGKRRWSARKRARGHFTRPGMPLCE